MAGVVGAVIGGAIGGLALLAGPEWALRAAFVVFVFGTVQAIRLPAAVDSSAGEVNLEDTVPIPTRPLAGPTHGSGTPCRRRPRAVPTAAASGQRPTSRAPEAP